MPLGAKPTCEPGCGCHLVAAKTRLSEARIPLAPRAATWVGLAPDCCVGDSWGDEVTAAAMIDRLVHHAEILALNGDSYRLIDRDLARPTPVELGHPEPRPRRGRPRLQLALRARLRRGPPRTPQMVHYPTDANPERRVSVFNRRNRVNLQACLGSGAFP